MSNAPPAAEPVTFNLYHSETTRDYVIRGAEPIRSLLGPDARMLPERVRVFVHNDYPPTIYVHGPKLSAQGKPLKTQHSRPMDGDDPDAPEWLVRLAAHEETLRAAVKPFTERQPCPS